MTEEIVKTMIVSTAYLPKDFAEEMSCEGLLSEALSTATGDNGWLISTYHWIPEQIAQTARTLRDHNVCFESIDRVAAVMAHATAKGCKYVLFHADGGDLPESFPVHEW
jgi:hypothetical protein